MWRMTRVSKAHQHPEGFRQLTANIRKIAQKHSRAFSILGALLVFATFITKDGWRDNLRDLVSSVEAAETQHQMQNMIHQINYGPAQMSDPVYLTYVDVSALRGHPVPVVGGAEFITVQRSNLTQTTAVDLLDGVSDLLLKAPSKDLQKQHDDLFAQLRTIEHDPRSFTGGSLDAYIALVDKAARLESDALKFANAKLAKDKIHYSYATRGSYILYAFGWLLGFMGKLFGVDGAEIAG
jgi:hypothetical protein